MTDARNLQNLVERRLRELGNARGPLSARQAAEKSEGLVSYETLRLLLRGQHSGRISRETAEGMAKALDVPLDDVLAVAGQRIPLGPFVLPTRADTLTPPERQTVLSVVDAILNAADQERPALPDLRAVANSTDEPGGTRSGSGRAGDAARRVRTKQDGKDGRDGKQQDGKPQDGKDGKKKT
jgi:hypothetical protein